MGMEEIRGNGLHLLLLLFILKDDRFQMCVILNLVSLSVGVLVWPNVQI